MNRNTLYQTLIRAGRAEQVESDVPIAFEARVLDALERVQPDDSLREWASVLWKAAFSSAGLAVTVFLAAVFLSLDDARPWLPPSSVAAVRGVIGTESSNGPGDEIATVLIDDLEEGESW